jgi:hypothetical protein
MSRFDESNIQQAILKWARVCDYIYPELALLHAIPNGADVSEKNRIRLVKEGLLCGVPDLFLPAARYPYHGLYIEIKTEKGRVSEKQQKIHELLIHQGYRVEICRNSFDAIDLIETYLKHEKRYFCANN